MSRALEREQLPTFACADLPKLLTFGSAFYTGLNCCTYPLAVIKTRMQASAVQLSSAQAARELLSAAGPRGFYAGLAPVLLGALPARAGYITALEATRSFWQRRAEAAGLKSTAAAVVSNGLAGLAAVLASCTIYTPVDVITQRVMVASGTAGARAADKSAAYVLRDIWSTSGWTGFYRGFGVTLVAYLPGGSVWWAGYGGSRAAVAEQEVLPPLVEQAAAATWASLLTVVVTSPLDVLKTRVQLSTDSVAPPLVRGRRTRTATATHCWRDGSCAMRWAIG